MIGFKQIEFFYHTARRGTSRRSDRRAFILLAYFPTTNKCPAFWLYVLPARLVLLPRLRQAKEVRHSRKQRITWWNRLHR